jgi:hypothetical protein
MLLPKKPKVAALGFLISSFIKNIKRLPIDVLFFYCPSLTLPFIIIVVLGQQLLALIYLNLNLMAQNAPYNMKALSRRIK